MMTAGVLSGNARLDHTAPKPDVDEQRLDTLRENRRVTTRFQRIRPRRSALTSQCSPGEAEVLPKSPVGNEQAFEAEIEPH
jgi:hypothetical protein